jgi:hypothetical protein
MGLLDEKNKVFKAYKWLLKVSIKTLQVLIEWVKVI